MVRNGFPQQKDHVTTICPGFLKKVLTFFKYFISNAFFPCLLWLKPFCQRHESFLNKNSTEWNVFIIYSVYKKRIHQLRDSGCERRKANKVNSRSGISISVIKWMLHNQIKNYGRNNFSEPQQEKGHSNESKGLHNRKVHVDGILSV